MRFKVTVPPYAQIGDDLGRILFYYPTGGQRGMKYKAELFLYEDSNCPVGVVPDAVFEVHIKYLYSTYGYFYNFGDALKKFIESSEWFNVDYITFKLTPLQENTGVLTVSGSIYFRLYSHAGKVFEFLLRSGE